LPPPHKKSFAAEQLARQKKKNPWPWIVAGIAVVSLFFGGYMMYRMKMAKNQVGIKTGQIKSIAVLPFDNLSDEPGQESFAASMQDVLITNLWKISSLRVPGKTSVNKYKQTEKTIPEIARELNVDALIEGFVYRVGDTVRINVQLIRGESDEHIWADDYVEKIENIIFLQSKLAQDIAEKINIAVKPEEQKHLAESYKVDPEAYNYYLLGNDYFKHKDEKNIRIAQQMYEKAVESDPKFALAYAKLSQTHTDMYFWHYDRTDKQLTKAKEYIDRALVLNSDLPEVHLAFGWYFYHGLMDFERALEHYTIVRKIQPNNSELIASIAYVQRRMGKFEEAATNLKKASEIDPSYYAQPIGLGLTYEYLRRYPEAMESYNKAISRAPDSDMAYRSKASLYVRWKGNIEKAREVIEYAGKNTQLPEKNYGYIMTGYDINDRNYEKALDRISNTQGDLDGVSSYLPKNLVIANIYNYMNKKVLAHAYYDSVRVVMEAKIQVKPDDARYRSTLGRIYAGLGRNEDAIREGELAVELYPLSKDALFGPSKIFELARIYVTVGEFDKAVDQLEFLLIHPSTITVPYLRLLPVFDPLRDNPRFQKLLEKYDIKDD